MKIRSITSFYDPALSGSPAHLQDLAEFNRLAKNAFTDAGIEVQSTRLATTPFPISLQSCGEDEAIQFACALEETGRIHGFGYSCCGPALPEFPESYDCIPAMLKSSRDLFMSAVIADQQQIYPQAVHQSARIIHAAAQISSDGFTNLRFAALANVKPGGPFLPGAFHQHGASPAFSIAIECADAALDAFLHCSTLAEGCQTMISRFEDLAQKILRIMQPYLNQFGLHFNGFDFSPAPFPEDHCSLAGAIEAVGAKIGRHGSLAAAAVIADALGKGSWQHAGYNGLMLPVLEDSILAQRAAEGNLTTQDLLMFSAVCGTGLDTVPLPGDSTVEEIESILMDVAALAVRLGKPLTARLMPVPGKKAGDLTEFDFGYFKNSRILPIKGQALHAPLIGQDPIPMIPRDPYK